VFEPGRMHCVNVGGPSSLHHVLGIVLIIVVIAGPILTAIYLSRRAADPTRSF
jgi:hypothetical protein